MPVDDESGAINFEDPWVTFLAKAFLVVGTLGILSASLFGMALTLDWYFFQESGQAGTGSDFLSEIVMVLQGLSGPKVSEIGNTLAIFGISVPLLIGKVCFAKINDKLVLSSLGRFISEVLILALLLSLIPYLLIEPDVWGDGHTIQSEGVAKIQEWIKAAMRTSAIYLAALFGVRKAL